MLIPFAIAGIQMHISAIESNLGRMQQRLDVVMQLYPWVQMVLFSELAAHGPFVARAEPVPGPTEEAFREMALYGDGRLSRAEWVFASFSVRTTMIFLIRS